MEPKSKRSLLFIGFFLIGWLTHSYGQSDSLLLENLLCSDTNSIIKKVMASPDLYRVQVVYSFVEKDEWNCPKVQQYRYRLRNDEYFYPASLVKLPVALLALEWLDKNNLTKDMRLHSKAGTLCTSKPAFPKDTSTISQIIQKSLVVSDNRSFNELYELLGVNYIHTALQSKGLKSAMIFQRLDNCDYPTNLSHDTVFITNTDGDTLYRRGKTTSNFQFVVPNAMIGSKFYHNGRYIDSGKNFKHCNRLSLSDVHLVLMRTIYQEIFPLVQQFCLSDRDRQFLVSCLSQFPNQLDSLRFPKQSSGNTMDFKYILAGGTPVNFPENVRIFNKVGLSYGFMEDVAYVVDTNLNSGFFVSCVLFANEDGYMNDGKYEYNTIGFPFMKRLGRNPIEPPPNEFD